MDSSLNFIYQPNFWSPISDRSASQRWVFAFIFEVYGNLWKVWVVLFSQYTVTLINSHFGEMLGGRNRDHTCGSLVKSSFKGLLLTLNSRNSVSLLVWELNEESFLFPFSSLFQIWYLKSDFHSLELEEVFFSPTPPHLYGRIKCILISLFINFSHRDIITTIKDFYRLNQTILNGAIDLIPITIITLILSLALKPCHLIISHSWRPSSSDEIKEHFSVAVSLTIISRLQREAITNPFRVAGATFIK